MSLWKNSNLIVATIGTIDERLVKTYCGAARSCLFVLVLGLGVVLSGCSPAPPDSFPARAPGVSVVEHWQTLGSIEDSLERTAAMAQFVTTLGPGDLDALEELATGMYWRNRSIDHLILMNAWSRLDPEAAMKVAAISRASTGMAARADGVREWASKDPEAVIAAQVGFHEPEVQRALVRGWWESGLPGLSDYVLSDGKSRAGQNTIASYAEELGYYQGADGIAQWLDSVRSRPGLDQRTVVQAHRKGIVEMAVADAEAAIAYCDLHCDQPYATRARMLLADRLGRLGHVSRAMEWVEASVDANPQDRGRAGQSAFGFMMRADQEPAFVWVDEFFEKYRGEDWIEPIVSYAIAGRSRLKPEKSLDWVHLLPEGDQKEVLIGIARRWIKIDPEAGERWLETSPLDEEAREEARTPLQYSEQIARPAPGY